MTKRKPYVAPVRGLSDSDDLVTVTIKDVLALLDGYFEQCKQLAENVEVNQGLLRELRNTNDSLREALLDTADNKYDLITAKRVLASMDLTEEIEDEDLLLRCDIESILDYLHSEGYSIIVLPEFEKQDKLKAFIEKEIYPAYRDYETYVKI